MAPPSDADSTMARVSHEFADLPGDDGESQSLRRRRFAEGAAAPRARREHAAQRAVETVLHLVIRPAKEVEVKRRHTETETG